MKKNLILGMAMLGIGMTSCNSEKNYYDDDFTKKTYEENFKKLYSQINIPEMEWDFTSGPDYSLISDGPMKVAATRAGLAPQEKESDNYYEVESATIKWLNNTLKESTDNRKLGNPFTMTMPDNTFTLVPIYQGTAGMTWDLHMVVESEGEKVDMKVWTKSQGIQKMNSKGKWEGFDQGGSTLNATAIRSKMYEMTDIPLGANIYFYLEVTTGATGYATKGTKQSSLKGMMLTLDCPRPTNISAEKEVMVIGCEDADLKSSDWDMNDIVFLVIGNPKAPKPEQIEEVTESYEKRYMIEDLGSTDDFDFNDIVVDVKASRTIKYHYEGGTFDPKKTEYGDWTQKAIVKHLGGTLPFELKIGNTIIKYPVPAFQTDPNQEYDITGWEPKANNITVSVFGSKNGKVNENPDVIPFPKKGEVPMIISFDTKKQWMEERQSIPESWFKE